MENASQQESVERERECADLHEQLVDEVAALPSPLREQRYVELVLSNCAELERKLAA